MKFPIESTQFIVGEWTVEPSLDRIFRQDIEIILEPRIMELLVYLAQHAGQTVSADAIAEHVWRSRAISNQPIYQAIAQLRKALSDEALHPSYIATIPKKGYRLIAPIRAAVATVRVPRQPGPNTHFLATVMSLFLACGFLFLGSSDVSISHERHESVRSEYRSIAVLPFVDLSENHSYQYIGDGIADELIHRIGALPDVRVVARTSSFALRNESADVIEIGDRLDADVVLEGSIRYSGERVRITAQLVETDTGYPVWSANYEPQYYDSFSLPDQIAATVVSHLETAGDWPAGANRIWTASPDAAEAQFLGMFHMHKRRPDTLQRALAYFKDAIAYDPGFTVAHAALAKTYFLASDERFGPIPAAEALAGERAAFEVARSLDSDLPQVLELQANEAWRRQDFAEVERLLVRAISVGPNYAPAYKSYGHVLRELDRHGEAVAAFERATRLDPLSPVLRVNLGTTLAYLNRKAEAAAEFERAIELDPQWHVPYYLYGESLPAGQFAKAIEFGMKAYSIEGAGARFAGAAAMLVAYNFLNLEEFEQAEQWYDKARQTNIDGWRLANERVQLLLAQDRYAEASVLLDQWENEWTDDENTYRFGGLYRAVLGQDERAIELLENAASVSGRVSLSSLYLDTESAWGYMPAVYLAYLYMRTGVEQQGTQLLRAAKSQIAKIEEASPGIPGIYYIRASIAALQGRHSDAIDLLNHAADAGWWRAWFVERDPVFTGYRNDPRFIEVLGRMRMHIAAERNKLGPTAASDAQPKA